MLTIFIILFSLYFGIFILTNNKKIKYKSIFAYILILIICLVSLPIKDVQAQDSNKKHVITKINSSKEKTTKKSNKNKKIKYDKLQQLFLSINIQTTENDLIQYSENNNLEYTIEEYNGEPKKKTYKIAFKEAVALQKYADSGDYVEVTFNNEDGSLMYMEYFNNKKFKNAILYNYGTYWEFMEKEAHNKYTGYYYHKPGDSNGGITIKYNNGNRTKTGYHKVKNAKKALKCILKKNKN